MNRDARLRELMADIEAGRLFRNQNFEAYKRPEVLNARARRRRMMRLFTMLERADTEQWRFSLKRLESNPEAHWELICVSKVLNGSWIARLFDFELEMLYNHPRGSSRLPQASK